METINAMLKWDSGSMGPVGPDVWFLCCLFQKSLIRPVIKGKKLRFIKWN